MFIININEDIYTRKQRTVLCGHFNTILTQLDFQEEYYLYTENDERNEYVDDELFFFSYFLFYWATVIRNWHIQWISSKFLKWFIAQRNVYITTAVAVSLPGNRLIHKGIMRRPGGK
jgi:hypothetical protein